MADNQSSKPKKRVSLSQAVQAQQPTTTISQSTEKDRAATQKPRTGRIGTKLIAGHFGEAAAKQFKLMAVEQDKTAQVLLEEAINDLFRKYGKEPIA